jgi:FixJ family two-component response regulator
MARRFGADEKAMNAGAVEFLTKPFRDDVLLNAIRHATARSYSALGDEAETRSLRERRSAATNGRSWGRSFRVC